MQTYRITSSAGVILGFFMGETEADALDALARDAGYRNHAEVVAEGVADDQIVIEEVTFGG